MKLKKLIRGTGKRPRLAVFRSNKHIYIQAINDEDGTTILTCSTLTSDFKENNENSKSCQAAHTVGQMFGKKLLEKNIKHGIFDRRNRLYHGRLKALAEGIREAGILF